MHVRMGNHSHGHVSLVGNKVKNGKNGNNSNFLLIYTMIIEMSSFRVNESCYVGEMLPML